MNDHIIGAMIQARDNRRFASHNTASDQLGTTTITLPPGDIHVTDLHGLMGAEDTTMKIRGLRVEGAGSDLTQVIFDPTKPGVLAYNRYWQNVKFEGITFSTTKPDCTFLQSVGQASSAPQEFTFTDVKWNGPWKYGIDLRGGNNNSEFRFFGCATSGMQTGGAFLHIGAEDTSDQFLNYWFYGFKHWSTAAALIDAARGGHFHLYGVDASAWGGPLTEPGYLLNLRGHSHAHGVQSLTADGLRVEAKNALAGLLHSEWADGNVSIQADWSSQTPWYDYQNIIRLSLSNTSGAVYTFHDSNLAGGVRVDYGPSSWTTQPRITFRDCVWRQRLTPSEVVTYGATESVRATFTPPVQFVGCRGEAQNAASTGAAVWDATVGHATVALAQPAQPRSLTVRGPAGIPNDRDTIRVHLPVGAYITGFRAVSPPTISTDRDGAAWTLATTEPQPGRVSTVTVEGPLGAGYNVTAPPMIPFACNTRDKATLTVKSEGNPYSRPDAFLVVEGYW